MCTDKMAINMNSTATVGQSVHVLLRIFSAEFHRWLSENRHTVSAHLPAGEASGGVRRVLRELDKRTTLSWVTGTETVEMEHMK